MKAERIPFSYGRIDIVETPEEFPLGARGQRPVRFTLWEREPLLRVRELQIPGVVVSGSRIDCAWDAAPSVARYLGVPGVLDEALQRRLTCEIPLPGLERWKEFAWKTKLRDYQREAVRYIFRRAYALLGDPPRSGKCPMLLGVIVLADAQHVLIICNSLGKYVWASEVVKWLGEEAVLLFGRAGAEARVYCAPCDGRGKVDHPTQVDAEGYPVRTPCEACKAKNGQSLGERIYLVRQLELATEREEYNEVSEEQWTSYETKVREWASKNVQKAQEREQKYRDAMATWEAKETKRKRKWEKSAADKFAKWEVKDPKRRKAFKPPAPYKPLTAPDALSLFEPTNEPDAPLGQRRVRYIPIEPQFYRCPDHPEETDVVERDCLRCREEMVEVIRSHRVTVTNYDILGAQKDKADDGKVLVRTGLPGWLPTLARVTYDIAIASESHRIRGWEGGSSDRKSQTRREHSNAACIDVKRVYAETGTPMCGFVRDFWGQLDFISGGLWS